MAATRTVPGAAPSGPLTKAQRKAAAQQSAAAPLAAQKGDPTAVNVEVKPKDEGSSGRPDKKAYDDEQNELRSQIDALQAKANDLRNKISSTSVRGGPDHERKLAIRKEMDELRAEQAKGKGGREKTLEKLKQMQDALKRKIDDMTSARSKVPYKTVQDVDNQIKSLERQVESGSMKLVDEKKALSEISSLRKSRKVVESFDAQQAAIDADKAKIDEVRKELDDPEQKAVSKKMGELRKELDEINKKFDEISKNRDGLFEERNAISKQLDELFDKKKASTAAWREANNKYYKKIEEDRQKRDERRKAERKAAEDSKRAEVNQRLLEEAQAPAFEREIEDCKTLIRFFQQRIGLAPADGAGANGGSLFNRPKVAGVPDLEIRKVDAGDMPKGTVLKKKGEQEEESWGGLAKSKGKKGRNAAPAAKEESAAPAAGDEKLNLPFGTLTALMTLGITAPLTTGEVQKTIDSLQLKMKYFTDNQDRVTKERIAAVEAKIAKAASSSGSAEVDAVASTDATASEEKIKDAQPQPIEENGSKEEAVKNAEGETEVTADAATEDAKEDA